MLQIQGFQIIVLIFGIVIHEYAHGYTAYRLGDPTAKNAGRLTLNPLAHLDPLGSVILPLLLLLMRSGFIIGWAKPVPFNPYYLRDQKYGVAKVAIAGPGANLVIAIIFGLLYRFVPLWPFEVIVVINVLLAIFNLIPVPPLDGSKILFTFLPSRFSKISRFLETYGMFVLLFVIFFVFQWIWLIVAWLSGLILFA